MTTEEKYLTPKEVATICGVSYATIQRWIKSGKLPVKSDLYPSSRKRYYILESDIPSFLRK